MRLNQKGSGEFLGIIVIALAMWGIINFFHNSKASWQPHYDNAFIIAAQSGPIFNDENSCLDWIHQRELNPGNDSDFECGKNCKPPNTIYGPYICNETSD